MSGLTAAFESEEGAALGLSYDHDEHQQPTSQQQSNSPRPAAASPPPPSSSSSSSSSPVSASASVLGQAPKPTLAAAAAAANQDIANSRPSSPKAPPKYTVAGSDTLASIAVRFGVTSSEIVAVNRLVSRTLFPGQVISLPASAVVLPPSSSSPSSSTATSTTSPSNSSTAATTPALKELDAAPLAPSASESILAASAQALVTAQAALKASRYAGSSSNLLGDTTKQRAATSAPIGISRSNSSLGTKEPHGSPSSSSLMFLHQKFSPTAVSPIDVSPASSPLPVAEPKLLSSSLKRATGGFANTLASVLTLGWADDRSSPPQQQQQQQPQTQPQSLTQEVPRENPVYDSDIPLNLERFFQISDNQCSISCYLLTANRGTVYGILSISPAEIVFHPDDDDPIVVNRGVDPYSFHCSLTRLIAYEVVEAFPAQSISATALNVDPQEVRYLAITIEGSAAAIPIDQDDDYKARYWLAISVKYVDSVLVHLFQCADHIEPDSVLNLSGITEALRETTPRYQPQQMAHPVEVSLDFVSQSSILTREMAVEIINALPLRVRDSPWHINYSTFAHGISLKTFYRNQLHIREHAVVLLITDMDGNKFGAYASEPFRVTEGYIGSGECFLFRLTPTFEVFRWTFANHYFMHGTIDGIAMGGGDGGFGLWFDNALHHGATKPCLTFDNRPLTDKTDFFIAGLEAWALLPSP
ncbi:oxidation resistance protein 1 [Capsaspora owczarzaki ATCC 30864]|uniref:Oxidation resistance protein 1 n=1 Tax=Capsaspora owczarzaki (strain ATCC 30864) TaxID=595528 RepID=A0A0D2WV23_CAPO3|nr:oxidation resistance protein 1 [Capsaspora owczarzaki ATCC 30864]KJE95953.1 oxidation resistance protein 1 [Capsaspora owczarzaki ATCC 30864]|eukprot:XP_004345085.1 oxidation resistance protein 1 [Capsaspora owczarzaki ATCC 30864]